MVIGIKKLQRNLKTKQQIHKKMFSGNEGR